MKISLEQLKNLIIKYDKYHGEYPEHSYEGLSVYNFICQELGVASDIHNDLFDVEYFNLLEKFTVKENNNEKI